MAEGLTRVPEVVGSESVSHADHLLARLKIGACVSLAFISTFGTACAYETDFHYYAVYLLLRSRGYQAAEADALAGFSQYVDDNARTEPINCTAGRRAQFHFAGSGSETPTTANFIGARAALAEAFSAYAKGEPTAKYRLGAALHLFADSFSHATFTAWWNRSLNCRAGSWRPCIGHADTDEEGHAPDRPYNAPSEALRAAKAIYELIPPVSGGIMVPWTTLETDLARAFEDAGRGDLTARIEKLRRTIRVHFHEPVRYDQLKFRQEKSEYEAAVLK